MGEKEWLERNGGAASSALKRKYHPEVTMIVSLNSLEWWREWWREGCEWWREWCEWWREWYEW